MLHPGGPGHGRANLACAAIQKACQELQRSENVSPVSHALARAIQHHAVFPFQLSCAASIADARVLVGAQHVALQTVWVELEPLLRRLIASATEGSGEDSVASSILSCTTQQINQVKRGSPASSVLAEVWRAVFGAYSIHLSQWLQFGTVNDARGDFFICRDVEGIRPHIAGMPPGHSFYIEYGRLPSFISHASAQRIHFAGSVVSCVNHFVPEISSSDAKPFGLSPASSSLQLPCRQPVHDAFDRMITDGATIDLSLEASSLLWREAASREMSRLIPIACLGRYLRSLREFLLLGNEVFWHFFFDYFRPLSRLIHTEMSVVEVEAVNRALEHVLETSLADAQTNSVTPCVLSLRVEKDGQLSPSFDIPFPSSAVVAPSARSYSDLFSLAFGVRRVSLELDQCYMSVVSEIKRTSLFLRARNNHDMALRVRLLRRCLFLRMRMALFIKAFDDFLQADVFEGTFRGLLRDITVASSAPNDRVFDDLTASHARAVSSCVTQSLAGVDTVRRRVDEICSSCMSLCEFVRGVCAMEGSVDLHAGVRIENVFEQNASLLLRVMSSLQSKTGSTRVGALLLRLDWARTYDSGAQNQGQSLVFEDVC